MKNLQKLKAFILLLIISSCSQENLEIENSSLELQASASSALTSNLALGKVTEQSSTGHGGISSRAVDGNTSGVYNQGSVTHTNSDYQAFWQVRLGAEYEIGQIVIWNRTDCCLVRLSNFDVFVYDDDNNLNYKTTITSLSGPSVTINPGGAVGSRVRIKLKGTNFLSLAEVQVFGEDDDDNSDYTPVPSKIEAEDYDDATEGRTQVQGSVTNVGWIDSGEFLSYNISVPSSDTYDIDFRVASKTNNSSFDIYQGNSKIGSVSTGSTGGWNTWKTETASVNLSSGNQNLRIVATGGGWNIDWIEVKYSGDPQPPTGPLDPNKTPAENFDLSQWKLTPSSGNDYSVAELNDNLVINNQFFTANDGGMVFKNYPLGAGTTTSSTYSRVELREMLDTSVKDTEISKNNWIFSSSSSTNQSNSGGVGGKLTATLKVDRVTTTSDSDSQMGRIVIGQIHASSNEPCRLYYKLMPGDTRGAIYFMHEDRDGEEIAVNMIGDYAEETGNGAGDYTGASQPSNGITLGEIFHYKIEVIGTMLYVDIYRNGHPDVSASYNMNNSGYADDYMYFKAGLYSQNKTVQSSSDYEQVTFYALENTHD